MKIQRFSIFGLSSLLAPMTSFAQNKPSDVFAFDNAFEKKLLGEWQLETVACKNGETTAALKEMKNYFKNYRMYMNLRKEKSVHIMQAFGKHNSQKCLKTTYLSLKQIEKQKFVWNYDVSSIMYYPSKEECGDSKEIETVLSSLWFRRGMLIEEMISHQELIQGVCPTRTVEAIWKPATSADIPKHEVICQEKIDQIKARLTVNECACSNVKKFCS